MRASLLTGGTEANKMIEKIIENTKQLRIIKNKYLITVSLVVFSLDFINLSFSSFHVQLKYQTQGRSDLPSDESYSEFLEPLLF